MGTVRRTLSVIAMTAAVLATAAQSAVAGEPDPSVTRILQMQTAFNPGLPGAGEGVRAFTKTLKHMSGGALSVKIVEPGRIAPTRDMLDAIVAGDLEAAFTWAGYAVSKSPVMDGPKLASLVLFAVLAALAALAVRGRLPGVPRLSETPLSLEEARRRFYVTKIAHAAADKPDFSQRIRGRR